ncbi:unnamed protein product [Sympodiomycopsis kandeliae]
MDFQPWLDSQLWLYSVAGSLLFTLYVCVVFKTCQHTLGHTALSHSPFTLVSGFSCIVLGTWWFENEAKRSLDRALSPENPAMKHSTTFTGDFKSCLQCDQGFHAVAYTLTLQEDGSCITACAPMSLVYLRFAPFLTMLVCSIFLVTTNLANRAASAARDKQAADLQALAKQVNLSSEKMEAIIKRQDQSVEQVQNKV